MDSVPFHHRSFVAIGFGKDARVPPAMQHCKAKSISAAGERYSAAARSPLFFILLTFVLALAREAAASSLLAQHHHCAARDRPDQTT